VITSVSLPPQSSISLYIHIPFCTVKCGYCDFFSLTGVAPARMEETVSSILEDAVSLLPPLVDSGAAVETVYVGGGTPSVLSEKSLRRLTAGIRKLLPNTPREWTVELNPETLTEGTMDILGDAGVDRLSLGVQTLSQEGLSALGRAATAERTRRAVELLTASWKGRWNGDLILGFQGDSPARVARDLELLTSSGARHLSVYALTLEEGTPLATAVDSGTVTLPRDEEVLELLSAAQEVLSERGLRRYEVSNYAFPGEESLHNLRYWRMEPYLGLGPAAASTLYYQTHPLTGLRMEGVRDLPKYLAPFGRRYTTQRLSTEELLEETLLMGLRTSEGVSLRRLRRRFGLSPEAVEHALESSRLLRISPGGGGRLTVVPEEWNILDRAVLEAVERLLPLAGEPY
jgi:oxygen-independent coproporphyrinogen-3 oxidase